MGGLSKHQKLKFQRLLDIIDLEFTHENLIILRMKSHEVKRLLGLNKNDHRKQMMFIINSL